MLDGSFVLDVTLLMVCGMMMIVMTIAWFDFDRPRHALTWAITFGLIAVREAIQAVDVHTPLTGGTEQVLMITLRAVATATNTVGFRQRAMLPPRAGLIIGSAIVPTLATVLVQQHYSGAASYLPLNIFDTIMLALAARTLIGRRRGERVVQRIAYFGLVTLSVLSGLLVIAKANAILAGNTPSVAWTGSTVLMLFPPVVTGLGLISIFLLAADQADQTRRLAATDLLTGLLNRRGFEEAAEPLIAAARSSGRAVSLALVDIDRFKDINDSFGHQTGDGVIARFAGLLSGQSSRRDLLARIGGEEFALLMADADLTAASCAAEVTREIIAATNFDLPEGRTITASFGIAELGITGTASLGNLLAQADEALYRAKAAGRNRVMVAGEADILSGTAAR